MNKIDRSLIRPIARGAIPIALQSLIMFTAGFINSLLVSPFGDAVCGGVHLGNQIQMLVSLVCAGIESSILVLGSRYRAVAGDRAGKICLLGTAAALFLGVLSMLVCIFAPRGVVSLFTNKGDIIDTGGGYLRLLALSFPFFCLSGGITFSLRTAKLSWVGTVSSAAGLAVNLLLGIPLCRGLFPSMPSGAAGLAIATLTARIFEAAILLAYTLIKNRSGRIFVFRGSTPTRECLRELFLSSLPLVGTQLVWAVNLFSSSAILGRLGGGGFVAAVGVSTALYNLAYSGANGLAGATAIEVGRAMGEGDTDRIRALVPLTRVMSLCVGIFSSVLVLLLRSPFISLYNGLSAEAIGEANKMIWTVSAVMPLSHYQAVGLFGLVRGSGDLKFIFLTDLSLVFLLTLPLGLALFRVGAPPWAVFASLKLEQGVKCIISHIKVGKFKRLIDSPRKARGAMHSPSSPKIL